MEGMVVRKTGQPKIVIKAVQSSKVLERLYGNGGKYAYLFGRVHKTKFMSKITHDSGAKKYTGVIR